MRCGQRFQQVEVPAAAGTAAAVPERLPFKPRLHTSPACCSAAEAVASQKVRTNSVSSFTLSASSQNASNSCERSVVHDEPINLLGKPNVPIEPSTLDNPEDPEDWARLKILDLLHAHDFFVGFTWGGHGMSLDWVIKGIAFQQRRLGGGKHIMIAAIDAACVFDMAFFLQQEGFEVSVISVTADGSISENDLRAKLRKTTTLVSLPMASVSSFGLRQPIETLRTIVREEAPNAMIHCDVSEVVGRLHVDLTSLDVDVVTFGGKDVDGPQAIGVVCAQTNALEKWHHGPEEFPPEVMMSLGRGAVASASLGNGRRLQHLSNFFRNALQTRAAAVFGLYPIDLVSQLILFAGPRNVERLPQVIHMELRGGSRTAAVDLYERVKGQVVFRRPVSAEEVGAPVRPLCEFLLHPQLTEAQLARAAEILILALAEIA